MTASALKKYCRFERESETARADADIKAEGDFSRPFHGSPSSGTPAPRTANTVHIVGHNAGEEVDKTLFDNWTGGGADELERFGRSGSAMGGPG